MASPRVNPAVGVCVVESGYLAWDRSADRIHQLNPVGALILELCDGHRTAEQICALAAPAIPAHDTAQAERFLAEAIDAGLLISDEGPAGPPAMLSPSELAHLSQHLWEQDEAEAAFQCARRWTEIEPENPDAWYTLGRRAQSTGRRALAADALEQYLAAKPDDAIIRHTLVALKGDPVPDRAPDECVVQTFVDFASHYDTKMRENLRYEAPERLNAVLDAELNGKSALHILELGCGTGLAGDLLKKRATRLTGIDLSPQMLELAAERGIHDRLEQSEIHAWLEASGDSFDLIASCDCLVYFGDLCRVTALVARRLQPQGLFAFTVECGSNYPFELSDSGRFTHHSDHIRRAASLANLEVRHLKEGFLRTEAGQPVIGWITLLRKPAPPPASWSLRP